MNRARTITVALFVALGPCATAFGQSPGGVGTASGFRLYSARLTAGFDNGTITDEAGTEGNVLVFAPTSLAYSGQSERSSLQLIYEPEFEIFRSNSDLNSWNHAAGARYSIQGTRNFAFRIGGTFLHTQDRSRQSSGLAASPRGLYVEGRSYVSFDYRLSRETEMRVGLNSWLTRTEVPPTTSTSGEVEEWRNSLDLSLSRTFAANHKVSVRYTHLETSVLNAEDIPGQELQGRDGEDALNVGYDVTVQPGLRVGGSVGAIRLPGDIGSEYTYAFSGQIEKAWTAVTLGGGYRRTLSGLFRVDEADLADGVRDPLLNSGVAQSANLRLSGQVAGRVSLDQVVSLSRTETTVTDDPIESFLAALSVGFSVTDRVVPLITIAYWDQNASDPRLDFSRTRVTAGFLFYWDPPPSPQRRRDHEAVRSILPTRGGR